MRAKFLVDSVKHTTYAEEAEMFAISSGTREDNEFALATPAGKLTMTISAPAAKGFLVPGKMYYLDFTEAK